MTESLAPLEIEITPTFVVSTALATRDWTPVHHDRELARSLGSQDVFVNILTSQGLVQRFVTDRLGPDVEIRSIDIRLGAPAYPGDTLTLSGERDGDTIAVTGTVSRGAHITGTVRLA